MYIVKYKKINKKSGIVPPNLYLSKHETTRHGVLATAHTQAGNSDYSDEIATIAQFDETRPDL
jgi:hypothetical protein